MGDLSCVARKMTAAAAQGVAIKLKNELLSCTGSGSLSFIFVLSLVFVG